jgi:hypothetical protein
MKAHSIVRNEIGLRGPLKEDIMRRIAIATLLGASLAVMTAPANAAWKSYVSHKFGFSFEAPGEVKVQNGTYRGQISGPQQTIVYRSVEDKVTLMPSFKQAQAEGANILGERAYNFQNEKKVLMDTFGRVEPGKDSIYGRKITVEQPNNGGRTTAAFYFNNGTLYSLEATVLPANGDYASPDPGRFIDSIVFVLTRTQPGATDLTMPPEE